MKQKVFYFFIFLSMITCVFLVNSCKKNKNTITINGRVYDPYGGSYLSGAQVTVSSSKVSSGFYNSNYTDIASVITDANGVFSFEFEQEKTSGYRFYIIKENYFDRTIDVADADIQPENMYAPTFDLYPIGYLKLHVKNNEPYNDEDYIAYSYNITNISCLDCCSNTVFKGYGKTYDTTYRCKTYGSKDVQVNWHVTKWGIDIAHSDTVYCAPFDTTYYEILY